MSQVDHIDDIQFSTAFEVDKIIPDAKYNGSFTVGASSSAPFIGNVGTHSITNNLGENVLPLMVFSTDNTNWLEAGATEFSASSSLDVKSTATCYTTASNIVVVGQNFTSGTLTFYYKIVLLSED